MRCLLVFVYACVASCTIDCPICLEELTDDLTEEHQLCCAHVYHKRCLKTWVISGGQSCPLCRKRLPSSMSLLSSKLDSRSGRFRNGDTRVLFVVPFGFLFTTAVSCRFAQLSRLASLADPDLPFTGISLSTSATIVAVSSSFLSSIYFVECVVNLEAQISGLVLNQASLKCICMSRAVGLAVIAAAVLKELFYCGGHSDKIDFVLIATLDVAIVTFWAHCLFSRRQFQAFSFYLSK